MPFRVGEGAVFNMFLSQGSFSFVDFCPFKKTPDKKIHCLVCGFAGVIVRSFQNTQVPSKQPKATIRLENTASEDVSCHRPHRPQGHCREIGLFQEQSTMKVHFKCS